MRSTLNSRILKSQYYVRRIGGVILNRLYALEYIFHNCRNLLINNNQALTIMKKRVAIIAVYSNDESLDSNILEVMNTLQSLGYHLIVVNNGSSDFVPAYESTTFLMRINKARDLGAFRDALTIIDRDEVEELILLNDSVFWNSKKLYNILLLNLQAQKGIFSLVESQQRKKHAQSFFLLAKNSEGSSSNTEIIFETLLALRNSNVKRNIVNFGEIRISENAQRKNIEIQCFYSYERIVSEVKKQFSQNQQFREQNKIILRVKNEIKLNPSIHFAEVLLDMGAPFLKKSIFQEKVSGFSKEYQEHLMRKFHSVRE